MNQADMNQDVRGNLSAGIDGELSKEQLRFLLRQLDHDTSLQQAWADYHLARDGLRRQLPTLATAGFASRVMLAIEQEAMPATGAKRNHWLQWSAGGAIAASVAAVALMMGQPTGDATRMTASTTRPASEVATATPASKPVTMPAAVPPWLSGNSAGMLSQQASATLGAPFSERRRSGRMQGYPPMHRYRTLDNNDGSYLLLLDPEQQIATPDASRRAASSAQ